MKLLFEPTAWPEERVVRDLSYVEAPAAGADSHPKHRLDLFLPAAIPPGATGDPRSAEVDPPGQGPSDSGWPVLVFAHGGGWREGDKALQVGGEDVYGNIGRFYASRGFAVAVINYRLQPEVTWREQTEDVARAVRWLSRHVGRWGGDGSRIFLSGHSAGAQLVTWVTLSPEALGDEEGSDGNPPFDRRHLCGVVAISGAGYDLADAQTYSLGADPRYYEARFRNGDSDSDWRERGSGVTFLGPPAEVSKLPPFLVVYAGNEYPSLQHQAALLHRRLGSAGVESELVEIPKLGHRRIVVAFSQEDGILDDAALAFLRRQADRCADSEAGSG